MEEFQKSVDGKMQYSKEELDFLARQGIDPNRLLQMSSEQQKYKPSLEKKLAAEAFDVLRQGTRDAVQQEFSLVDPDIVPPSKAEKKYRIYWDNLYISIKDIVMERNKEVLFQKIFELVSFLDDTLREKPEYLDLQGKGYGNLEIIRGVLVDDTYNDIDEKLDMLTDFILREDKAFVEKNKQDPSSAKYRTPFFDFRKNAYEVDIFEN